MAWRIVPMAEEHVESFWAAVDSVAREHRYLAFLEGPPLQSTREFVASNLQEDNPHLVALVGDSVVGWCDVVRHTARPVFRHGGVLGIGVVRDHRGQGIGPALLEAAIAAAQTRGITRIELVVRDDNVRARKLYERFGFVHEGRLRRHMWVDGEFHDSFQMALLLEQARIL
jgi:RimJ/RimL family protein N-acetyltransferase